MLWAPDREVALALTLFFMSTFVVVAPAIVIVV